MGCIFPFHMGMGTTEYSECTADVGHIGAEHQDPDTENTGTSERWCATQVVSSGAEKGKVQKWRFCNNCV